MKVREIMTTDVVSVAPGTPLKEVAGLLARRRISGVPVLDESGALVGVVSEADFVAKEAGPEERRRSWVAWLVGETPDELHRAALAAAQTAGAAMSSPPVTVGPDDVLSEAARRMAEHRVNRLPVVENGRLVGIVSRADVVRAYARSDAELLAAVRASLHAVDGVGVSAVRDGVVVLSGTAASEALARALPGIVRQIDGVVAVDDRDVSWEEPATPATVR